MSGNLKDFMVKHGIKRIDFDAIEMSDAEEEYATDKLVCPYCGCEMEKKNAYNQALDDVIQIARAEIDFIDNAEQKRFCEFVESMKK